MGGASVGGMAVEYRRSCRGFSLQRSAVRAKRPGANLSWSKEKHERTLEERKVRGEGAGVGRKLLAPGCMCDGMRANRNCQIQ